mgnify:CR=1 FL=1
MGRIALIAAALVLAIRLVVLWRVNPTANSDEAIVGLMATQVAQGGPIPVFFYGNPYLGSLEALVAAASFLLFGPSTLALRLAPLCLWAAYLALLYALARRILGPRGALAAVLVGALPPSFVAVHVELAVGSYSGTLATGLAVLLLADLLAYPRRRPAWREDALAGGLGLASGLALWTHPQTAPYLVAAAVLLLLRRRDLVASRRALLAPLGLAVALAPVVAWNAANDWGTATFLLGNRRGFFTPFEFLAALQGVVTFALPEALGVRPYLSGELVKAAALDLLRWSFPSLVVLGLAWLSIAQFRSTADPVRRRLLPVLVVVGVNLLLLTATRFGGDEPPARYLAPLSSVLPLVIAWLLLRLRLMVALPLLLAVLVTGANQSLGAHPQPNEEIRTLGGRLEAIGISRVYAGYWTAYALAFESRGSILVSPRFGPATTDRMPESTLAVEHAPASEIAFVFPTDSAQDRAFAGYLADAGIGHTRESLAGSWHLYYGFPVDPRPTAELVAAGKPTD